MRLSSQSARTLVVTALALFCAAVPVQAQQPPATPWRVGGVYRIIFATYHGDFRVLAPPDASGLMPVVLVSSDHLDQMLGAQPLWVNARLAALVQDVTPQASANAAGVGRAPAGVSQSAALAAMRSELRNLSTAQEAYFADHVTYTNSLQSLRFEVLRAGVTITVSNATANGWSATAVDASLPGYTCGIYVGSAPASMTGQTYGEPLCVQR